MSFKTVYALTTGSYSDYSVRFLCTSKEAADKIATESREKPYSVDRELYEVEEYILYTGDIKPVNQWRVTGRSTSPDEPPEPMYEMQEVLPHELVTSDNQRTYNVFRPSWNRSKEPLALTVNVFARSKAEANRQWKRAVEEGMAHFAKRIKEEAAQDRKFKKEAALREKEDEARRVAYLEKHKNDYVFDADTNTWGPKDA